MPLGEPPPPAALSRLPERRIAGQVLHRVFRRRDRQPWWFSSVGPKENPDDCGRFDLPPPDGACYLGTSKTAAALEAFQDFGEGLLPDAELRARARAEVEAPRDVPAAAGLTSEKARGAGVTAALWSGSTRSRTQAWTVALRRAGWRALYHGIQHDPSGRLRAVTLLDTAGAHPPYDDPAGWAPSTHGLHDDEDLLRRLARFGIHVTRSDPQLPVTPLDDTGLV